MNDEIKAAEQAGRTAALEGEPLGKNPHSMAQGSPTRVLAIAWRRGFRQGEIDQADGEHFKAKS